MVWFSTRFTVLYNTGASSFEGFDQDLKETYIALELSLKGTQSVGICFLSLSSAGVRNTKNKNADTKIYNFDVCTRTSLHHNEEDCDSRLHRGSKRNVGGPTVFHVEQHH